MHSRVLSHNTCVMLFKGLFSNNSSSLTKPKSLKNLVSLGSVFKDRFQSQMCVGFFKILFTYLF